jgi:hypothetical protein
MVLFSKSAELALRTFAGYDAVTWVMEEVPVSLQEACAALQVRERKKERKKCFY